MDADLKKANAAFNSIVMLVIPKDEWDIMQETLTLDSHSKAFDASLRTKISDALDSVHEMTTVERVTALVALHHYRSEDMGEPARRPIEIHDIATGCAYDEEVLSSLDDEGIRKLIKLLEGR